MLSERYHQLCGNMRCIRVCAAAPLCYLLLLLLLLLLPLLLLDYCHPTELYTMPMAASTINTLALVAAQKDECVSR